MNEILRVGRVLVKEGELSLEVKGSVVVTRSYSGTQDGGDRHLALRLTQCFFSKSGPFANLAIGSRRGFHPWKEILLNK